MVTQDINICGRIISVLDLILNLNKFLLIYIRIDK